MKTLTIVPLSTPQTITRAALDCIKAADKLYFQTLNTPCVSRELLRLSSESMDDVYESSEDFDALSAAIADRLTNGASCVYAVPGDGCFALLPYLQRVAGERGFEICVLPGVSYAKAAFPMIQEGTSCAAANLPANISTEQALLIQELHSYTLAAEVKLKLAEFYPDEHMLYIAQMGEDGGYSQKSITLCELDRQRHYHATTVVYIPPLDLLQKQRFGYEDLVSIMRRLRAPGGCPWDREQTHESLKRALMEECYELMDAIDAKDDEHMLEELGDVLMQIPFHAVIAEEYGRFNPRDVSTAIVSKLIYRHPHIFGEKTAHTADEVLKNWDLLKQAEKGQETVSQTLDAVPHNFPALLRAQKVQKRAAKVGFDWENAQAAFEKLTEETAELAEAMAQATNVQEEVGDLLFTLVNIARLLHFDTEETLNMSTNKFVCRFTEMERLAKENGEDLEKMSFQRQNELWDMVKANEMK